jgi:hypothetical protein
VNMTRSSNAESYVCEHNTFRLGMLNLTFATITYSSHAESDVLTTAHSGHVESDGFFAKTHSSHAKSDVFDHDTF